MTCFGPKRCGIGLIAVVAIVALAPSDAYAAAISYYLQTFNVNPNPNLPTANYAKINLTGTDAGTGTVTFEITTNFAGSIDTGARLTEVGFTLSSAFDGLGDGDIAVTTSPSVSYTSLKAPPSNQLDGYGNYQWALFPASGGNNAEANRVTSLSFSLTGVNALLGGTAWDDLATWASNIFVPNADNRLFAAKYFPSEGETGYIDGASSIILVPPPPPVPEPSSLALFGIGLCSVLGYRRFRRPSAEA
ncbi:MAG: PEP-CTERM sorting domain-containing protein [Planctomycetaceae bacterium]